VFIAIQRAVLHNGCMDLIMLGAGGHAHSILDALAGTQIDAFVVPAQDVTSASGLHRKVLEESRFLATHRTSARIANGIGQMTPRSARGQAFDRFRSAGFEFETIIHPSAVVSALATLGEGAQVLAGAIVGPGASVGANTVINSAAIIEHHCSIGANVHVGPGAVICGDTQIEDHCMIGAGSTIIQGLHVETGVQLGAGAVLVSDAHRDQILAGVPAKPLRVD